MTRIFRFFSAVLVGLASCSAPTPSEAGPNSQGTLILVQNPGVFSNEETFCDAIDFERCSDGVVRHDGSDTIILSVLGAFNELTTPRVAGVAFGWIYDESEVFLHSQGPCGDFELSTSGWPGSGEGTAVTFQIPRESSLVEVYWVALYNYYGNPQTVDLAGHPTQGAIFADDAVPSNIDTIAGLGSFGFGTDGELPCPPNTLVGRCCLPDLTCEEMLEEDCLLANGEFGGHGTLCEGGCFWQIFACCLPSGECIETTPLACEQEGGVLHDATCDGVDCVPVPTLETTWGQIKELFR